jgi:exopolysaccharide biosynthesis polyprenyl glycosylphosphotransferase
LSTTEATISETVRLTPVLTAVDLRDDVAEAHGGPAVGGAKPPSLLRRLLVAVDAVAVAVGWAAALLIVGGLEVESAVHGAFGELSVLALLAAITIVAVASQRLYLSRVCTIRAVEIVRLGRAAAIAGVASLLLPRVLPIELDTQTAVVGGALVFLLLLVGRGGFRHWLQAGRKEGRFVRPVIVIGANDEAAGLCKLVKDHPELGFRLAGIVGSRGDELGDVPPAPILGSLDQALAVVQAAGVSGVIVAASALPQAQLNHLIREFLRNGIHVQLSSGLRGIGHRRLRAQPLAYEPLFYVEPLKLAAWQLRVKRVIDVALTVIGGVLVLPVVVAAAIGVKLQDRGPVFYRQQRIGRHGRPFTIVKFRTMVPDADKLYMELALTRAGRDGPLIKLADDPRRTRIGRVLERTSIDELPQLLNVLRGEMSLVGPRPAQESEVKAFDQELLARLEVLPGITGLWQVEARDNPHFSAYRRYDLFYLENWSVSLDLAILVATVQRVLLRGTELLFSGKRTEMAAALRLSPSAAD